MGMCGPSSAAGGVGVTVPLRRDGRFAKRPYDGVWGNRGCDGGWWWEALRQAQGERNRGERVRRGVGSGMRRGTETPLAAPRPWVPASAGTTMWVGGSAGAVGGVGVRVPLRRDGRFAVRPCEGVWGRGCGAGWWWGALRQAQGERMPPHLWTPVCAEMTRVRDPSTGSGRTELQCARATGWGGGGGEGDAPRRAPLDSCLRRNDARGGVRCGGG